MCIARPAGVAVSLGHLVPVRIGPCSWAGSTMRHFGRSGWSTGSGSAWLLRGAGRSGGRPGCCGGLVLVDVVRVVDGIGLVAAGGWSWSTSFGWSTGSAWLLRGAGPGRRRSGGRRDRPGCCGGLVLVDVVRVVDGIGLVAAGGWSWSTSFGWSTGSAWLLRGAGPGRRRSGGRRIGNRLPGCHCAGLLTAETAPLVVGSRPTGPPPGVAQVPFVRSCWIDRRIVSRRPISWAASPYFGTPRKPPSSAVSRRRDSARKVRASATGSSPR